MRLPLGPLVIGVGVALGACRQIAGIGDIELTEAGVKNPEGGDVRGDVQGDVPHDVRPMHESGPFDAGPCGCDTCELLAMGLDEPLSLVRVGTDLYFLDYGTAAGLGAIGRVSTSGGGTVETFVGDLTFPISLTTDGTSLYYLTNDPTLGGIVQKVAVGGSGKHVPTTLATHQSLPTGLIYMGTIQFPTTQFVAVSSSDVFWISFSASLGASVMRAPIAGGATTMFVDSVPGEAGVAAMFQPTAIAVDSNSLFVMSEGTGFTGIFEIPLGAGSGTIVAEGLIAPIGLAFTTNDVVFLDEGVSFTNGTLQAVSRTGGMPKVLAQKLVAPWAVTASGTDVFWINSGNGPVLGSMEQVGLTGGTPVTLVPEMNLPEAIAEDATNLYWVDSTCGTVSKVAKSP